MIKAPIDHEHEIHAAIMTIGDEILYGQTQDTNAHFISGLLTEAGIKVVYRCSVQDREHKIKEGLRSCQAVADIVITTGGLGPTKDDITKKVLADYFGVSLEFRQDIIDDLTAFFERRNRTLNKQNEIQAYLPQGTVKLHNEVGTACGLWHTFEGTHFFSTPGVPHEMRHLMNEQIMPKIRSLYELPVIYHRRIRTVGIPESILAEMIAHWEDALPSHMKLAYLPDMSIVTLRISAFGSDLLSLKQEVDKQEAHLLPLLGTAVFGYGDETLEEVLGHMLKKRGLTLAIAESCTGGLLTHSISKIPGASEYLKGGVTAYTEAIKHAVLNVQEETLASFSAVSAETALEMAMGVRRLMNADIAVSTTGYAGPGGGTDLDPVGTVYFGFTDGHSHLSKKQIFFTDRAINQKVATQYALNLVRSQILKREKEEE